MANDPLGLGQGVAHQNGWLLNWSSNNNTKLYMCPIRKLQLVFIMTNIIKQGVLFSRVTFQSLVLYAAKAQFRFKILFLSWKNYVAAESIFPHSIYVTERGLGTMGTWNPRLRPLGMKIIIYTSSSCPQGYFAHSKKTSLCTLIYKKLRSSCHGDLNIFFLKKVAFPATCILFKISGIIFFLRKSLHIQVHCEKNLLLQSLPKMQRPWGGRHLFHPKDHIDGKQISLPANPKYCVWGLLVLNWMPQRKEERLSTLSEASQHTWNEIFIHLHWYLLLQDTVPTSLLLPVLI